MSIKFRMGYLPVNNSSLHSIQMANIPKYLNIALYMFSNEANINLIPCVILWCVQCPCETISEHIRLYWPSECLFYLVNQLCWKCWYWVHLAYHWMSQSLEVARFISRIIRSLWNLTGVSVALLLKQLLNFTVMWSYKLAILGFR